MINNNDLNLLSTSLLSEKKIRKLTWDQLSENLPIAGNSLRMSFKRNNVKYEVLEQICENLGIDIHERLKILREQRNQDYIHSILVGKFEADFYKENYDNPTYLDALPTYLWKQKASQDQFDNHAYRTFEIGNNEMNDSTFKSILIGDFVLCKIIPRGLLKSTLKPNQIIGFLHWDDGLTFRQLKKLDWKNKELQVVALSEPQAIRHVNITECAELYEIVQLHRQTSF
jgi:DNA-binding Xre family transcriptional regulator